MRHVGIVFLLSIALSACAGEVLPPDPGLEGGKGGHWGTKNDSNWVDGRWNNTEFGPFQNYTLQVPGGFIAKGISIKLGEQNEASVCFDASRCAIRAAWKGKFLKFDGARYGLIKWPVPEGELLFQLPDQPCWGDAKVQYKGLHVNGKRVVLSYTVDGSEILESPWFEKNGELLNVSRTIQYDIPGKSQTLLLAHLAGATGTVKEMPGFKLATLDKGDDILAVVAVGGELKSAGDRVTLSLTGKGAAKILLFSVKKSALEALDKLAIQGSKPEDLTALCKPGPKRWGEPIPTKGTVSTDAKPYVLDTITAPYANPQKALLFLSGLDFFENGDAAVSTLHGDVWVVRGIDDKLENVTWQRFATGLFQPMGVKVIGGKVHVMCRDQLVILHDENNDGEADYYETFNNAIMSSTGPHDYSGGLETDGAGNFYHIDAFGMHRISKDGSKYETLAAGFRNPVSMSVGPGDVMTASPQEGNWTPASAIIEVKAGGWYGHGGPKITPERPLGYDPPLCYVPRLIDNSTGGHLWVNSEKWGPLNGQLLNLSFGSCSMQLVLREVIAGQAQGGVVPFGLKFIAGAFRGRFRPQDGQLYVLGTMGWSTSAVRDGSFQRVRYTGAKVFMPSALNIHANGIRIIFTEPFQKDAAEDLENYSIEQWNYRYSEKYGSPEYSVAKPETIGHDAVTIKSAKLAADGKSVFLEIENLQPVMQMRIKYILKNAAGESVRGEIDNTINKLGPTFTP